MTTEALSVWIQRAGRAGRDGWLSRAILLVEPSVAKKLGAKSSKSSKSKGNTEGGGFSLLHRRLSLTNFHEKCSKLILMR